MLHRITGRAVKCGPAAISAIVGVSTHEVAAIIHRLFNRSSVNGVYTDELAAALAMTARLCDSLKTIDVDLHDHIVVTAGDAYSFREKGLL